MDIIYVYLHGEYCILVKKYIYIYIYYIISYIYIYVCKSQPEHDEWMVSWTPHPGNPGQKVAISKAAVVAPVVGPAKRPVASPATSKVTTPVVSVLSPPIKSPETKKMRVGHEPDEEPVTPEDDSCTSMASPESVGSTRKDLSPALEDAVDAPETPPTMRASPKAL